MWHDSWLHDGGVLQFPDMGLLPNESLRVRDLIDPAMHRWDLNALQHYALADDIPRFLNAPLY